MKVEIGEGSDYKIPNLLKEGAPFYSLVDDYVFITQPERPEGKAIYNFQSRLSKLKVRVRSPEGYYVLRFDISYDRGEASILRIKENLDGQVLHRQLCVVDMDGELLYISNCDTMSCEATHVEDGDLFREECSGGKCNISAWQRDIPGTEQREDIKQQLRKEHK